MPIDRETLIHILARNGVDASGLEDLFGGPDHPVFALRSPGGEPALDVWEVLYDLVGQTGCSPILLGSPEDLDQRCAAVTPTRSPTPRELIDRGTEQLAANWLQRRRTELAQSGAQPPDGPWPEAIEPAHSFHTPFDLLTGQPLDQVIIALVPTVRPWEVAALLNFGGPSPCPPADIHVALWRHWYERHRAVVVAVTASVVEMLVERPPRTCPEALALAGEQYAYCPNLVEDGLETKASLAACLLGGSAWYFWWD